MRDLKHLIYFEHLLDDAANELVLRAAESGAHPIGYTCYHVPEVLLNLDNCFSVRMRAPRTGSMDISTYYLTNYLCGYSKALVERGIEGGYSFLDAIAGGETCSEMNRALEHFELLRLVDKPDFFVSFIDVPFKITEHGLKHYENQIMRKILEPMNAKFGTDISDAAIRAAVAEHNEVCRILTEIGNMRKLKNPPVTGYEYHVLCLVSYCCPKKLILPHLRETLEELNRALALAIRTALLYFLKKLAGFVRGAQPNEGTRERKLRVDRLLLSLLLVGLHHGLGLAGLENRFRLRRGFRAGAFRGCRILPRLFHGFLRFLRLGLGNRFRHQRRHVALRGLGNLKRLSRRLRSC